MKVRFLRRAVSEYNQAIDYYERQKAGLGLDFATEFDKTIIRITTHPEAWHPLTKDVRRCLINRFPYGILYAIEPDTILVLSVMNLYRNPDTPIQN